MENKRVLPGTNCDTDPGGTGVDLVPDNGDFTAFKDSKIGTCHLFAVHDSPGGTVSGLNAQTGDARCSSLDNPNFHLGDQHPGS